jgi:hypothetical protein
MKAAAEQLTVFHALVPFKSFLTEEDPARMTENS